jgi:putative membrane protein
MRVQPRIEVLDPLAPRLEPQALEVPPLPRGRAGSIALALSGVSVLLVGLAALQTGNFVADQFARSTVLGVLSLGVAATGFGLIGAGLWRELRGLFAVRHVDGLRARLADPATTREAAQDWLAGLPGGGALLPAVAAVNDPDAILGLLRAGPVADLRARSEALGRDAAVQIFAATAAIPSPALDGLLMGWRGARLVREVAELHGMRPGTLGTLSLLRRSLFSAAAVAAANIAGDTVARAALSHPMLRHLVGDAAGAGVAARRMIVLARATAAACSPVSP